MPPPDRVESPAASRPGGVVCGAPGAGLGADHLCLEVDIFRQDGRKRRHYFSPNPGVTSTILDALRFPGADSPAALDVKCLAGSPDELQRQSEAYMERWRLYWDGERWLRKAEGATLHDWNKWGVRLEFLSLGEPGGLPPEDGWPPVVDLPPGRYLLRILGVTWKQSRWHERELECSLRVLEGTHRDRLIFTRMSLRTPALQQRTLEDIAMLLRRRVSELPPHTTEEFSALLNRLRGIAVVGHLELNGAFLDLRLERRAS